MACDFFYPQPGGVEFHIYHLSQELIKLGHKVIIITHAYKNRVGVRYLTNGLKVYYVPFFAFYRQTTFPTVFSMFPILRNILIRENIDMIHGHASMSSLAHECIIHGKIMGIKTCLTDHSLFGFSDMTSIWGNKVLKFTLNFNDRLICVSNTCKENIVLRGGIKDARLVSVIPNAVVSQDFQPYDPKIDTSIIKDPNSITIVVISRLFPNKGADLLCKMIPKICQSNSKVKFLIAGDGPKFIDIQQTIEKYRLQDQVTLIGGVKHEKVRDVMIQGDIYLHPSLTEAFGTVLVEAASCGLLVVTTRVGGIPEVLPSKMTIFSNPSVDSLVENTLKAIDLVNKNEVNTKEFHKEVQQMYDWEDVAIRTQNVYKSIDSSETLNELEMIKSLRLSGETGINWGGMLYILCYIVDLVIYWILEILYPRKDIDIAIDWPKKHNKLKRKH